MTVKSHYFFYFLSLLGNKCLTTSSSPRGQAFASLKLSRLLRRWSKVDASINLYNIPNIIPKFITHHKIKISKTNKIINSAEMPILISFAIIVDVATNDSPNKIAIAAIIRINNSKNIILYLQYISLLCTRKRAKNNHSHRRCEFVRSFKENR